VLENLSDLYDVRSSLVVTSLLSSSFSDQKH